MPWLNSRAALRPSLTIERLSPRRAPGHTHPASAPTNLRILFQTLEMAGKAEDWDEIDKAAPRLPNTIQRAVENRISVISNVRFFNRA